MNKKENINYEIKECISLDDITNKKLKYKANFLKEFIMEHYFITSIRVSHNLFNNKIVFFITFGFRRIGITMDALNVERQALDELSKEISQLIDEQLLSNYKKVISNE